MKKIITLILLFASLIVHAQQVDTVEYFFDKDPGFGKGTKLPLTGKTIDTAIHFTAGNLPSGVHDLFVRLKNTKNQWSTLYQSTLLITNGIAGTEKITEAEYYYDTDPGIGKGKQLTLNSATIDSSLAFTVTGLTAGPHTIYIRLKDNDNQWSTVYQSSFLLSSGSATNKIIEGEYFFDKDPGFGKGTQITMNSTTLDSSFKFSVTGLATGVHTVYIRLKNSDNNWSFPYQGNFVLAPGTEGISEIKSFEYFTDVDKGVGKNAVLTFKDTANLDTTLSIPVPDNGADERILGLRVTDQTGQISSTVLNDISLCDLYKPIGGFRSVKYANGYTFIDTSKYNSSNNIKWVADNVADTVYKNSPVYPNVFPSGFIGFKTVMQIVGSGCRVDTSYQQIEMQGLEKIYPTNGYLGHYFVLDLYGGGLDSTTSIYLQDGSTIVKPTDVEYFQGKLMTATFDFHNVKSVSGSLTDFYSLHATFGNGYTVVLNAAIDMTDLSYQGVNNSLCFEGGAREVTDHRPDCATLAAGEQSFITVDLVGSKGIKEGTWNYYTLNATNTSGVLANKPVIWLLIPSAYDVAFDVDYYVAPQYSGASPALTLPSTDYVPIDTVINGKHLQYKLYGFIPPYISPGETRPIEFKLRSTALNPGEIHYWAQVPMFGSPLQTAWNCAWVVAGYFPGTGCFTSWYDWTTSKGGTSTYQNDYSHGLAYNFAKFQANYWWNTAGAIASCGFGKGGAVALKASEDAVMTVQKIENRVDKTITTLNNATSQSASGCPPLDYLTDKLFDILEYAGFDPNHMMGNSDYDTSKNYVNNLSLQHYKVEFENKPSANGNVQHVYLTDTLSPAKFDFNTFSFTGYRIGDSAYTLPPYRTGVYQTMKIPNRSDIQVQFIGSFDTATGVVKMDFYTMDSAGIRPIANTSLNGFLPPDVDGVTGTASAQFQVSAKNLGTLETFSNKASIYFDNNAPINTNTWLNTVDTTAPTSKIIKAIPINDTTVKLVVQGTDIGSGIQSYTLYGKKTGDSAYHKIGTVTSSSDSIILIGTKGQKMNLYIHATDNVANEERKTTPDITYTFEGTLPTTFLSFNAAKTGDSVKVSWSTGSEINVSHYDVEKSNDATAFIVMGSVPAGGLHNTNNYVLFDAHPSAVNYYRIREVDNDGKYTYSRVIRIDFGSTATLSVSPVPAHDYINIIGASNFDRIEFFDVQGRVVKQFNKTPATSFNIADLTNGTYFIRFTAPNNVQTIKFIKQ